MLQSQGGRGCGGGGDGVGGDSGGGCDYVMAVVRSLMTFGVNNSCLEMVLCVFQGGSGGRGVVAMVAPTAATIPLPMPPPLPPPPLQLLTSRPKARCGQRYPCPALKFS